MADNNVVEIAVQVRDATRAGVGAVQNGLGGIQKSVRSVTDAIFSMWGALAGGAAIGGFAIISEDLRKAEQAAIDAAQGSVEALEKIKAVSKEAWLDGFGGNAQEAAQMAATAFKEMGDVSEEELGRAATAGAQLESRFGADYQKTLQSIGVLMRTFGISAKEATDFVSAGFQNNLDASGDFIDSITEYSTQFKEAGAGASEFYSALETGAGRGIIGTDAVADSFKELNDKIKSGSTDVVNNLGAIGLSYDKVSKGLNDGTLSITDVFNKIQKAIKETENTTTQFQAGAALLGEPFIKMGQEAFLAIDTTKTKISELAGSTEKLNQGYAGLAASFTKLSREIIDAFAGEILEGSKQVEEQIKLIIKAVQDLKASGALAEWASGAGEAFSIVLGFIKDAIAAYPQLATAIQTTFANIEIYYNKFLVKLNEVRAAVAGLGSSDNPQVAYFNDAAKAAQFEIDKLEGLKQKLNEIPIAEAKLAEPLSDLSPAYAKFLDNIEGLEAGTLKWGETTKKVVQDNVDLSKENTDTWQKGAAEFEAAYTASLENVGNKAAEPKPINIDTDDASLNIDDIKGRAQTMGETISGPWEPRINTESAKADLDGLIAATNEQVGAYEYVLNDLKTAMNGAFGDTLRIIQQQYTENTRLYNESLETLKNYQNQVAQTDEEVLASKLDKLDQAEQAEVSSYDNIILARQEADLKILESQSEGLSQQEQAEIDHYQNLADIANQAFETIRQNYGADTEEYIAAEQEKNTAYSELVNKSLEIYQTAADEKKKIAQETADEEIRIEQEKLAEMERLQDANYQLLKAQAEAEISDLEYRADQELITEQKLFEEKKKIESELLEIKLGNTQEVLAANKEAYGEDSVEFIKATTDKIRATTELNKKLRAEFAKPLDALVEFKGKASPVKPLSETFANIQAKFAEMKASAAAGMQTTLGFDSPKAATPQIPTLPQLTGQAGAAGTGAGQNMGTLDIKINGQGGTVMGEPEVLGIIKKAFANEQRLGYA